MSNFQFSSRLHGELNQALIKGAITSKIKRAITLKTSRARLARLVLSFIACFILLVIAP